MALKTFLAYRNAVTQTGVSIAATSEATAYPAVRLLSSDRQQVYRSVPSTGNVVVTIQFPAPELIKTVLIGNWRAHTGGSIKLEYHNGSGFVTLDGGTGLFSLPTVNINQLALQLYAAGRTTSQIRVTFINTLGVTESVELGLVFAGSYTDLSRAMHGDFVIADVDQAQITTTLAGQERVNIKPHFSQLRCRLSAASIADRDYIRQAFYAVGIGVPCVLAGDPSDLGTVLYGTLGALEYRKVAGFDVWDITLPFKESL